MSAGYRGLVDLLPASLATGTYLAHPHPLQGHRSATPVPVSFPYRAGFASTSISNPPLSPPPPTLGSAPRSAGSPAATAAKWLTQPAAPVPACLLTLSHTEPDLLSELPRVINRLTEHYGLPPSSIQLNRKGRRSKFKLQFFRNHEGVLSREPGIVLLRRASQPSPSLGGTRILEGLGPFLFSSFARLFSFILKVLECSLIKHYRLSQ